ncbi:MAG: hypothetical protein PHX08_18450, partial [Lachnospiraceae bacterium]|nr:hypothetical protein [Lachnospiraceae bacterium]
MKNRIGKDGFEYWSGFDSDDFDKIEFLSIPWQRYFINRVKTQLECKNWSQSELCKQSATAISKSSLLDEQYCLLSTTLSQYINAHS